MTGEVARVEMLESRLPANTLRSIWKLADIDKDGLLNEDEFGLAMYLIKLKRADHELPTTLPDHLYPPSMYHYCLAKSGAVTTGDMANALNGSA